MYFEIISGIQQIEVISKGLSVRERKWLVSQYGKGCWRKLKGIAAIRTETGMTCLAEVHWYEAHGIGRRKFQIKRFME